MLICPNCKEKLPIRINDLGVIVNRKSLRFRCRKCTREFCITSEPCVIKLVDATVTCCTFLLLFITTCLQYIVSVTYPESGHEIGMAGLILSCTIPWFNYTSIAFFIHNKFAIGGSERAAEYNRLRMRINWCIFALFLSMSILLWLFVK